MLRPAGWPSITKNIDPYSADSQLRISSLSVDCFDEYFSLEYNSYSTGLLLKGWTEGKYGKSI